MARKQKAETQVDIVKKERLRTKELIVSPEYQKDISRYEQLEKEIEDWRMVNRILIGPKEFRPSLTMQEHHEHINKGRKLRQNLDASCAAILKKYKITFPYPIDTLKEIAGKEGEPKGRLRESKEIPVRVLPSGDGILRQRKLNGYEVYLDADECFSIEINPRGSKTDILHYISKLLDTCAANGLRADSRTNEDKRLRDLEVYRLRALRYTYPKIATAIGISQDTARKAYGKAYEFIHGAPFKKGEKKEIAKAILRKDCATCSDRPSCKKLCAEVDAYSYQEWREEPKRHGRISEYTPDQAGPALPAKGKGSRDMGRQAFEDADE